MKPDCNPHYPRENEMSRIHLEGYRNNVGIFNTGVVGVLGDRISCRTSCLALECFELMTFKGNVYIFTSGMITGLVIFGKRHHETRTLGLNDNDTK